jgi:hypothetical protein
MAEIIQGDQAFRAYTRYPWDEWTDGQRRRALKGEDFHCSAQSLRVRLYQEAKKREMKVTTRLEGRVGNEDKVVFQFYVPAEPAGE